VHASKPDWRPAGGNRPCRCLLYPEPVPAAEQQGDGQRQGSRFSCAGRSGQACVAVTRPAPGTKRALGQDRSASNNLKLNQVGVAARQGSTPAPGLANGVLPAEAGQRERREMFKPGWEGSTQPGVQRLRQLPPALPHPVDITGAGCGEARSGPVESALANTGGESAEQSATSRRPRGATPARGLLTTRSFPRRVQRSVRQAG